MATHAVHQKPEESGDTSCSPPPSGVLRLGSVSSPPPLLPPPVLRAARLPVGRAVPPMPAVTPSVRVRRWSSGMCTMRALRSSSSTYHPSCKGGRRMWQRLGAVGWWGGEGGEPARVGSRWVARGLEVPWGGADRGKAWDPSPWDPCPACLRQPRNGSLRRHRRRLDRDTCATKCGYRAPPRRRRLLSCRLTNTCERSHAIGRRGAR